MKLNKILCMELSWDENTYLKSAATILTNNCNIQILWELSNNVLSISLAKGATKLLEVKLGVWKKSDILIQPLHFTLPALAATFFIFFLIKFFFTSKFDLLQFYSPLSHMDAQYLIWKFSQFLNGIVSRA